VVDEWEPKKGERVRFLVEEGEVHPSVPHAGTGVVLRKLPAHETRDYEIVVPGYGALCFYRSELELCPSSQAPAPRRGTPGGR
jgi:hypothetical protein